jgi:hypothetical protein
MTRCDDVVTSTGGEAAPDRKNGGDDVSWADTNLTGQKKNQRSQFTCYKWMVEI